MTPDGPLLDLELWKTMHAWQLLAARGESTAPSNAAIVRAIAVALRGGAASVGIRRQLVHPARCSAPTQSGRTPRSGGMQPH